MNISSPRDKRLDVVTATFEIIRFSPSATLSFSLFPHLSSSSTLYAQGSVRCCADAPPLLNCCKVSLFRTPCSILSCPPLVHLARFPFSPGSPPHPISHTNDVSLAMIPLCLRPYTRLLLILQPHSNDFFDSFVSLMSLMFLIFLFCLVRLAFP
ncbi:hypothetical protein BGW80DRAFT_1356136 [Lactifluus volemus]|nr:hypothetical protein BGW80DRAFT_1356136 [Lactifluus volemus]